jgi:glycosyltransferase involved in cell wall biosynthesis
MFPNTPLDGKFNFIYHSVESLRRAGHRVTVLITRPWTPRVFRHLNNEWDRRPLDRKSFDPNLDIRVIHYPSIPRNYWYELAGPLYRAATTRHIRELIRDRNIQVVHAHSEPVGYAAVPLAQEAGIPSIVTLHGINLGPRLLDTPLKRERVRRTLDGAGRVVLVGEPLREYFLSLAGRDDHFRLVPNGFFLPDKLREIPLRRFQGTLRVISVANLQEGKGLDLSLRALAGLEQAGFTDWTYHLVGGGPDREALEQLTDSLGLRNKVTFSGVQSHEEVFEHLRNSDLFLLPSYREAFGVAYLEAMAAGLFTIGVQGQGPEAFIRDGKTGILALPRDVPVLTSALAWCVTHPDQSAEIAAAGRRHAWQDWTWDCHAEKLSAVFTETMV